jgi:DNA-directed RNA polymerase subunit RPC12/RpoP
MGTRERPAPPVEMQRAADLGARESWLDLLLRCPGCGAPVSATPHDVTQTCLYCRSLLLVKGERANIWIQQPVISEPEQVRKIIIERAVEEFEMEKRRSQYPDEDQVEISINLGARIALETGVPAIAALGAFLLARELVHLFAPERAEGSPNTWVGSARFRRTIMEGTRVANLRRVLVPFAFHEGTTSRVEVDRSSDGQRRLRISTHPLSDSQPLYPASLSFRDAGLKASPSTLSRLESGVLADFDWIRIDRAAGRPRAETLLERSPLPDFNRSIRDVGVSVRWEGAFYRPYLLANIRALSRRFVVLIDAVSGNVVAQPSPEEARAVRKAAVRTAPSAVAPPTRVLASRCRHCGSDVRLGPRDVLVVCPNCRMGVEPTDAGLVSRRLDVAFSKNEGHVFYVPFWRFQFLVDSDALIFKTLEAWAASARNRHLPRTFAPKGPFLFVSAMSWSQSPLASSTFVKASRSVHFNPPDFGVGRAPDRQVARFLPVRVNATAARGLGRVVLAALLDDDAVARLNVPALDRILFRPDLRLSDPCLCYVGFDETGRGARRGAYELKTSAFDMGDTPLGSTPRAPAVPPFTGASSPRHAVSSSRAPPSRRSRQ